MLHRTTIAALPFAPIPAYAGILVDHPTVTTPRPEPTQGTPPAPNKLMLPGSAEARGQSTGR